MTAEQIALFREKHHDHSGFVEIPTFWLGEIAFHIAGMAERMGAIEDLLVQLVDVPAQATAVAAADVEDVARGQVEQGAHGRYFVARRSGRRAGDERYFDSFEDAAVFVAGADAEFCIFDLEPEAGNAFAFAYDPEQNRVGPIS